jgi:hypothetical protein
VEPTNEQRRPTRAHKARRHARRHRRKFPGPPPGPRPGPPGAMPGATTGATGIFPGVAADVAGVASGVPAGVAAGVAGVVSGASPQQPAAHACAKIGGLPLPRVDHARIRLPTQPRPNKPPDQKPNLSRSDTRIRCVSRPRTESGPCLTTAQPYRQGATRRGGSAPT